MRRTTPSTWRCLSSGLLKIVVVGGVASFSTAAAGADYRAPISHAPGLWPSTFAPSIATTSVFGGVVATTNPGGWYEDGINPDGSLSYGNPAGACGQSTRSPAP